ncbi:nucleotidyltransferase domain-containing protein [bacterium]|nr:nucleotidyltransferase domain-containing protein [bacterium]
MTDRPDSPDLPVGNWRDRIDEMRRTRRKQFLRVSRKMLNHLCSIGLSGAQQMLAEFDDAQSGVSVRDGNAPGFRLDLEGSPLFSGAPFELAAEFLGDEEIEQRLEKWVKEEEAGFFSTVVGDPRSTMPEIAQAIRKYHELLLGRSGLNHSTLKSLRVSLIQRFLTEQLDFINVAKEVVRITDFHNILDHVIMPQGSYGKLGGKASGLLLARWILEQPEIAQLGLGEVKFPRTWSIISDAIMDFIKLNDLEDVMDQKFKDITQVRREYPNMIQLFKNSSFPPEVLTGLSRALDYFGEVPLIIRSSSLLEDRFGTAFSGKYKSLFLANQGNKTERMDALLEAVAEVWASVLGPDPIEYRRERGLQEFVEEMGILIQEVVGTRVGRYWLPAFAGVAFSLNEFRWSPRIQRDDGLIRLVPGLGTRAVDRTADDFPVLAVPSQPGLRANQSLDEILRYCPRYADVINLETNSFETVPLEALLKEADGQYPLIDKVFSVLRNGRLEQVSRLMIDPQNDDLVPDMEGLLGGTDFIDKMNALLSTLSQYMNTPVDLEFAHDGKEFYLLQCRPQAMTGDAAPAPIPTDIPADRVIFTAHRHISNGYVPPISHIVYVDPAVYGKLPSAEAMAEVGRAVGLLNGLLPKRRFILIGPGRWGSRGDIKLGVRVTYADINNTAMLIEVARKVGNYLPDLSFGTHFFQDLVEAQIRYLPLYPDDADVVFSAEFLTGSANLLPELLPDHAHLAACVRVIDVPAVTGGDVLHVYLNGDQDRALAALGPEEAARSVGGTASAPQPLHEPRQFWRWRFRMAERMVRALDRERFQVKGVYLYGSVKNGTARPDSDIDLLVHFAGDQTRLYQLECWFQGWSLALAEMNYSRTGVRMPGMLDVTFVSDLEVEAGSGLAAMIGAVTNAARRLDDPD